MQTAGALTRNRCGAPEHRTGCACGGVELQKFSVQGRPGPPGTYPGGLPRAALHGKRRVMSARPLAVPPRRMRMTRDHVQAHAVQIQYSQLGLRPLEDFVGPQSPRRCACLVCGEIHEVAYAEIRNQHHRYCPWCACRQMHEQGLAGTSRSSRPPRWSSEATSSPVPLLPHTDWPQAAGSNFSSNVSLEPSGTGYVENLVRL